MSKRAKKTRFFGLCKKIRSLALSGIGVKRSCPLKFCENCMPGKKSGSQVMTKTGSCGMRFQYSLIVNISLID